MIFVTGKIFTLSQITFIVRLIIMKEDKGIEIFNSHRSLMISVCYRMLGSFSQAEEVTQEVAIEWLNADQEEILNPKAWMIRVASNKAIDELKKAYKKREVYPGTWLPEVLPDTLITLSLIHI